MAFLHSALCYKSTYLQRVCIPELRLGLYHLCMRHSI